VKEESISEMLATTYQNLLYGVNRNTNTVRKLPKRIRRQSAADDNTVSSLDACYEVGLAVIAKEQNDSWQITS